MSFIEKVHAEPQKAFIMGILNVTPDSFSDGGKFNNLDSALKHAEQLINEGADIIDIGGESTRPGHTQISTEEEISRVAPVIEALKKRFDIPLSIDAYRSETIQVALDLKIDLINDIWGLQYDPQVAPLVAQYQAAVCIMHNRQNTDYSEDFIGDVLADLNKQLKIAEKAQIPKENIILDPGLGFAKSFEKDIFLLKHIDRLVAMGYPVLLGSSRKRFIKNVVGENLADRDLGTAATSLYAYLKGCRLFRVHDVATNRKTLDMICAIEEMERVGQNNDY